MIVDQQAAASGSEPTTQDARQELAQDAGRLKDTATQRVKEEAETRKGQAARAAGSISSALDTAAEELEKDDSSPTWLSAAARQAASGIDRLASEMQDRSIDDIGQQITRFARTSPAAFLAASAAAGFAAARVLRAGAQHRQHGEGTGYSSGASGQSYGQNYGQQSGTSYGQSPGQSYGQSSGQTSGQGLGESSGQGSAQSLSSSDESTDAYVRQTQGTGL